MLKAILVTAGWVAFFVIGQRVRNASWNKARVPGLEGTTDWRLLRWVGAGFFWFLGLVSLVAGSAALLDGSFGSALVGLSVAALFLGVGVAVSPWRPGRSGRSGPSQARTA